MRRLFIAGTAILLLMIRFGWTEDPVDLDKIFVPTPRGAGETLDGASGREIDEKADRVITQKGNVLTGRVLGITEDGKLRLTDSQFDGEVKVRLESLDEVKLLAKGKAEGPDTVAISNGDSIAGEVLSISPEEVVVKTAAAGVVRAYRKVVRSVGFASDSSVLTESSFARGEMAPWKPVSGTWKVEDGFLVCKSGDDYHAVAARVDQSEAVTMEASVEAMSADGPCCSLVLFADQPTGNFGNNSVYATFDDDDDEFDLGFCRDGDTTEIINRKMDPSLRKYVIRLAYDPATGKAKFWLNSSLLGTCDIPNRPATGKYIMFNSYYPCKVKYLRVAGGAFSPSAADGQAPKETHLVRFANRDQLSTQTVSLSDGAFAFKTAALGQLKCQAENIRGVVFGTRHQERPRRQRGDVVVLSNVGRFTFKLKSLDGEHLAAQSDYLGEVKIRRSDVRSIKFNIYR